MSTKTKLMAFLAIVGLLGIIVLYVLEFQWFQNYFGLQKLILSALVMGVVTGLALGFFIQKKVKEQVERIQLWATCLLVPVVLMPLLASLANRLFAEQPRPTAVEFWEEKAYVMNRYGQIKGERSEASGYYVFVVKDGSMVRLESDHPMFPTAKQGDTVEVPVRKGLFGVEFVDW
ncbi:MAG: hypothetical protein IT258_09870 [Saprospiraceae bacterium]|nr:hypothetical protein [Saprospiraceae bacterium]